MPTPKIVFDLVERFREHEDEYRNPSFNETQTRIQFLDPLFEALGWDMQNKQGYAEAYKEVVHEDALKTAGGHKAPDYGFRIGGVRKFFLEAKKPAIAISADPDPAYQVRRYAWSAKLSLSILSNFAEFAVYDCRIRPIQGDKPGKVRTLYFTYEDLPERWDELAAIFSKEAILKGSFDKYAVGGKGKRGTSEVDDEFLREIESWRDALARNIALRNGDLTFRDLNYAVQQTIDRIIFLRISEDRGIESYGRLMALLNGENVYDRLKQVFRDADDRYNSGLFHFKVEKNRLHPPDQLTLGLAIDDKPLKDIIRSVYYPESPYEFSVLPADILGQVYEQFLGKVIRLTAGGHAKVEEKPEVKKAGGVYYTPTFIVDYIVRGTVGRLLEAKTPNQIAGATKGGHPLRVLDPACGSGSFLLGAFQYLLDWYRAAYVKNAPAALATGKNPKLFKAGVDDWRLTIAERKRILLDHIYGVDIDPQAVEVTKLSLLLKVLEGESSETLHKTYEMFHQRALPDLDDNIKCGNSLVGPDFFAGHLPLDDDERLRINAFDWHAEFASIMKDEGFDAVVGNPPYIRMEAFKELKSYLQMHYKTHSERADIFFYFVERSEQLLRKNSFLGFILSNTFTRSESGAALRRFMSERFHIRSLVEFGDFLPFKGATVYPIIVILERTQGPRNSGTVSFILQDSEPLSAEMGFGNVSDLDESRFLDSAWTFEEETARRLRDRLLASCPSLKSIYGSVNMGIKTGLNEAFVIDDAKRREIIAKNKAASQIIKPYFGGRNLDRWRAEGEGLHLIYTPHGVDMKPYPAVLRHLEPYREDLLKRATRQEWYELQQPQHAYQAQFEGPKIIYPDMSRWPKFSLDRTSAYFSNTVYFIPSDSLFLLGLLNSNVLWFVVRGLSNALRGGLWRFRLFSGHLERLPIPRLDPGSKANRAKHDKMVELVQQMLELQVQLTAAKTPHATTALKRQIAKKQTEINEFAYGLYGLSAEDVRIIEASVPTAPLDRAS